MTETVDVFYQETNYVTLLIFWLLIDVCSFYYMFPLFLIVLCIFFIVLYYVYDFIIK